MAYTAGACGVHGLAVWSCVFAGVPLQVSSNPRVFAYVCLQCLPTATLPSFEVAISIVTDELSEICAKQPNKKHR